MRTLVIGGARSGKSTHAESLAAAAPQVDYVATSVVRADDPDWAERVELHRSRRPAHWRTIETGDPSAVLETDGSALVLVDCVGVWLTRMMDECDIWTSEAADAEAAKQQLQHRVDKLVTAVQHTGREVVLVSNEVGMGVVPEHWSGRFFRDQLGIINMRLAAACDQVVLCVAGIPLVVKAPA